jgi:hypothetical protein
LANLTNLPVFNLFTNGLKNTIETQSATTKVTPEGIMITSIPLGSEFYPRFGDVVFIDGVPGAGKSDVVLRNILTMLGKDHPLRKRVISIHSSEQNAKRISDEYELNAIHNFDRKKFLSYASTDHLSKFNEKNDI